MENSKYSALIPTSVAEPEYLHFALLITEDIIRNNLFTDEEMKRVFNSHLEANRGRLQYDKMHKQIKILCSELNVSLERSTASSSVYNDIDQDKVFQYAKKQEDDWRTACIPWPANNETGDVKSNVEPTSSTESTSICLGSLGLEDDKSTTSEEESETSVESDDAEDIAESTDAYTPSMGTVQPVRSSIHRRRPNKPSILNKVMCRTAHEQPNSQCRPQSAKNAPNMFHIIAQYMCNDPMVKSRKISCGSTPSKPTD